MARAPGGPLERDMHDSGFRSRRGWMMWGVLAVASLGSACGVLPRQGSEFEQVYEVAPGTPRSAEVFQPNRTIQHLPTSIDPRTPEAMGTPGRSLRMDRGEQALLERYGERAHGGAGLERGLLPTSDRLSEKEESR
jgi:hypothetical protein